MWYGIYELFFCPKDGLLFKPGGLFILAGAPMVLRTWWIRFATWRTSRKASNLCINS